MRLQNPTLSQGRANCAIARYCACTLWFRWNTSVNTCSSIPAAYTPTNLKEWRVTLCLIASTIAKPVRVSIYVPSTYKLKDWRATLCLMASAIAKPA